VLIISVLVGILIPAVASVREVARRSQCANNLFQIGVALHNYHDSHRTFPPGYVARIGSRGEDVAAGWPWAAMLLPFLEQDRIYQEMRLEETEPWPSPSKRQLIEIFMCPSDRAACSYVASFGQGNMWLNPDDGDGVFYRNSRVRLRDIEDGPMTILVGERSTWLGTVSWADVYPVSDSGVPVADSRKVVDRTLVLGHTGGLTSNEPVHTPNTASTCGAGFGSMHADGAHFLMLDGSVRFISSQVDLQVFAGLATRSGGELVNLTDF
jgi:prepilin-type processing-associated H-X9-DG protein